MEKDLLQSYYQTNDVSSIQVESFNYFVSHGLADVLNAKFHVIVHPKVYVIEMSLLPLDPPCDPNTRQLVYPYECRMTDVDYDTPVYVNIHVHVYDTVESDDGSSVSYRFISTQTWERFRLMSIPVMVRSNICSLTVFHTKHNGECCEDIGGYFIINGKERVLVAQERLAYNYVYVVATGSDSYEARVRSVKEDYKYSTETKVVYASQCCMVSLPYMDTMVPLGVITIMLGSYDDFMRRIHPMFQPFVARVVKKYIHMTEDDALDYIVQTTGCVRTHFEQIVLNELFPHLCTQDKAKKHDFLANMVNRLLLVVTKQVAEDDRDVIAFKRVDGTNDLLCNVIRALIQKCIQGIHRAMSKPQATDNIPSLFTKFNFTNRIHRCFTKEWGVQQTSFIRQGVSQILCRTNFLSTLSHLRRVTIPLGKNSAIIKVRKLHASSYGFYDPVESPEGKTIGIVKNFANFTRLSTHTSFQDIYRYIRDNATDIQQTGSFTVMLNGIIIGYTDAPDALVITLRTFRRNRLLSWDTSVSVYHPIWHVFIMTDTGRLLRPVRTPEVPICSDWDTCVERGCVEYIDAAEAETSVISMYGDDTDSKCDHKCDFVEIHPSTIFGTSASIIPFMDHNQAPRNIYSSCMAKQAIGMAHTNYESRFDTSLYILCSVQKSLTNTWYHEWTHVDEMPHGINVVVAVMSHTGFNQEDSIIVNKSAVDRGLFAIYSYKTVHISESRGHGCDFFGIPSDKFRMKRYDYSKLSTSGIVEIGETVLENDVLASKLVYTSDPSTCVSTVSDVNVITAKASEAGVVGKIAMYVIDGCKHVKIRIRQLRIPKIGDKFAHVSGQKGTIGNLMRQEDMPFTDSGMVPDIIINAHAIPSRMTIGMLIEMITSKSACMTGVGVDGTTFANNVDSLMRECESTLIKNGFDSMGTECMYNGMLGDEIEARIFTGVAVYQRLKHMVDDKIHARGVRGSVQPINRQPSAGRSRDGGLRFGEMEKDSIIAHGASMFLKERLCDMSDPYSVPICNVCGVLTNSDDLCSKCLGKDIQTINVPYSFKLLHQNLFAVGVHMYCFQ
jgi:DNA-directed RNA polymerase II subunit RPB2